jgi:3-oxoacyl-[acyl-carrier protein] reductase
MDCGLRDKVVLVTGASKGIGRGIAEGFAREGAHVALCARGAADLSIAADALRAYGVKVVVVQADVTNVQEVQEVVDATLSSLGPIDVLVNNAGEGWLGRSWDTTDEQWQYAIDVNLLSAVRFTRLVVPNMRARGGGRIINIASVGGHTMIPGLADYQTAKAGLIAFAKSMSLDLAPDNILVNCVCPGPIRTPLWDRLADAAIRSGTLGNTPEEVYKQFAAQHIPLGRHGTVEEVAAVVVFLASAQASYITGSAYDVDGGFTKSTF